jgi:hypothetical protein
MSSDALNTKENNDERARNDCEDGNLKPEEGESQEEDGKGEEGGDSKEDREINESQALEHFPSRRRFANLRGGLAQLV